MYALLKVPERALAAAGAFALMLSATPAVASIETPAAKAEASDAAVMAGIDMEEIFGAKRPRPGQYLWRKGSFEGEPRVVVSISDQLAYLYRGDDLVAVAAISTGIDEHPTPTGIFSVLLKKPMHRSIKYDNAPMPFMQMIDKYGTALHAGHNPGRPPSHGCIRLPSEFAKRLYGVTGVGATVMIGI
ncbi:MAG TPA: L,D-transpeptidase family protein [Pseudolabrys sp.]|nr:L,D-transpeptidase family protein [Pseudolabrys sp.]